MHRKRPKEGEDLAKKTIKLNVNGKEYEVEVEPYDRLADVLREKLGLTGTKKGCDYGGCGACTVLLNGKAIYSCMKPAIAAEGSKIETIEGLSQDGKLHPIQEALVRYGAVQCGFCTPGMVMAAKALLDENRSPSEGDVREAIAGSLCRCTGYVKIVEAVLSLSESPKSL